MSVVYAEGPGARVMTFQKPVSRAAEKKASRRAQEKQLQLVRHVVLARDMWKCRHCRSGERIEVHHLKPRSMGGKHTPANLLCLCNICHAERHAYRLFIHGDDANKGVRFEVAK